MPIDEQDFHEFYTRWNRSIYGFCRMFLGDDEPAEQATQEAFVQYVREQEPLVVSKLPRKLMRNAIMESIKLDRKEPRFPETEELEDILPLLPPSDRAVLVSVVTTLTLPRRHAFLLLNLSPRDAPHCDRSLSRTRSTPGTPCTRRRASSRCG